MRNTTIKSRLRGSSWRPRVLPDVERCFGNVGNTPYRFYRQYGHEGGPHTHLIATGGGWLEKESSTNRPMSWTLPTIQVGIANKMAKAVAHKTRSREPTLVTGSFA